MASSLFNLLGGTRPASAGDASQIPAEFSAQLTRLREKLNGRDPMEIYNQLNLSGDQRAQVKSVADKIYNMLRRK